MSIERHGLGTFNIEQHGLRTMSLEEHGLSIEGSIEQLRSSTEQQGLNTEQHGLSIEQHGLNIEHRATAPYFYGSILLRAIKSNIIVVLTYVHNK